MFCHLELVALALQLLLDPLVALDDDREEHVDENPVDADGEEEEHHGSHRACFFQFSKLELVQHHRETGLKRSDQCLEVIKLAVEDEIEHLDEGSKGHEENAEETREISPASGKGVDKQRHLVIELEDLQELDIGKEDEQSKVVAIELVHKSHMLELHITVAKCFAEDIKQLVCDESFVKVESNRRNRSPYDEPLYPRPVGFPIAPPFHSYLSNLSERKVDHKDTKEDHESVDENASPSKRYQQSDWIKSPKWPNTSTWRHF